LELIVSDTCGPFQASFGGAKHFVTLMDKKTGLLVAVPIKAKSNGVAERANRTIKDRARAALADAGLGPKMWAEAVVAAVYVMNRSPRAGQDKTP